MAITAVPSSTNTPTSTAWSRLVQQTKNASSKTSPPNPSSENRGLSGATPATKTPAHRVRLRRPISSPSRITPSSRAQDQDITERGTTTPSLAAGDAKSIQVCPCPVGDPPLPDGRCSLSRQHPHKSEPLKSPAVGQTKTATLSAFRGAHVDEGPPPRKRSEQHASAAGVANMRPAVAGSAKEESCEGASHYCADDETGTSPVFSVPTQIPTTGSQSSLSPLSPASSAVDVKTATTATPSSSKTSRSAAAKLPASTEEPNVPFSGHEVLPSNHNNSSLPLGYIKSASTITKTTTLPHERGAARRNPASSPTSHKPKRLYRKEDTTTSVTGRPDVARLATPFSSLESPTTSSPSPGKEDEPKNNNTTPTTTDTPSVEFNNHKQKTKRLLALHSAKYDDGPPAPPRKKTKMLPPPPNKKKKQHTVQTTLSLAIGGGSVGMRECKVCDTVYNPLHPEDVKVHAKRHAGVLKKSKTTAGC